MDTVNMALAHYNELLRTHDSYKKQLDEMFEVRVEEANKYQPRRIEVTINQRTAFELVMTQLRDMLSPEELEAFDLPHDADDLYWFNVTFAKAKEPPEPIDLELA